MKTTVDIADELLRQAKIKASTEHRTLKSVVEEALRALLSRKKPLRRKKIRPVVVKGTTPPEAFNWSELQKGMYDEYELERLRRASES